MSHFVVPGFLEKPSLLRNCSESLSETKICTVLKHGGDHGTQGRVILKGTPYVYLRALSRPSGQAPPPSSWGPA
jgi:hypothetical protein